MLVADRDARCEVFRVTSPSAPSMPSTAADGGMRPMVASSESATAVSLRELIAAEGALPAEAVLECLQSVAELLLASSRELPRDPAQIFIDEDGEISLGTEARGAGPAATALPSREVLDDLARLLVYLATANGQYLSRDFKPSYVSLPAVLATFAKQLSEPEKADSWTYEAIAVESARLRSGLEQESRQRHLAESVANAGGEPSRRTSGEHELLPVADAGVSDRNPVARESRHELIAEEQPAVPAGGAGWLLVGALAIAATVLVVWFFVG